MTSRRYKNFGVATVKIHESFEEKNYDNLLFIEKCHQKQKEFKKALHIHTSIASTNHPAGTIHHGNYPEYIKTCEIAGKKLNIDMEHFRYKRPRSNR